MRASCGRYRPKTLKITGDQPPPTGFTPWELATTSEGTPVLKLPNGQYMDIAIEPLFASNPEETWTSTDNEDTLNDILDMVESEAVAYEFVTH